MKEIGKKDQRGPSSLRLNYVTTGITDFIHERKQGRLKLGLINQVNALYTSAAA